MKKNKRKTIFSDVFRFDFRSLKFKLWVYFTLFAVLLMTLLWFLQIFFLYNYYAEMKITETNKIAHSVTMLYGSEDFMNEMVNLSANNDLYIHIEAHDGTIVFEPTTYGNKHTGYITYMKEIGTIREALRTSSAPSVAMKLPVTGTNYSTLAYATYLDKTPGAEVTLYMFSPLYPVASTISILRSQLTYVTIISIFMAGILSIYMSRRMSKPITDINRTAKELAKGNYGIRFKGGHYSEIKNLADTLTYTSLELEKANTLQKDLIANVSHDLRTPLTMVKSYAEMIKDLSGDNPEKRNTHLQVIIDEADRLNVLVSDMLTMSRIQSGVITLDRSRFSIKEAAEALIHSYGVLAEQEGYTIILNCPDDIKIYADEAKIKQVISNLLNNAIKYCGNDRTVYVEISRKHGKMLFEVTDHGMGIAPEELEHIWDRYYKGSTNHVRATTGSGLGLSIVKSILSLHNADFGVNSRVGEGSTFWFEMDA